VCSSDLLELAQRIYNLSLIKLKNGVISSTDMLQVQNQFLQTQSDYFSSISELSKNKAKFEKLLTNAQ
jgi:outer membrane protein TolC